LCWTPLFLLMAWGWSSGQGIPDHIGRGKRADRNHECQQDRICELRLEGRNINGWWESCKESCPCVREGLDRNVWLEKVLSCGLRLKVQHGFKHCAVLACYSKYCGPHIKNDMVNIGDALILDCTDIMGIESMLCFSLWSSKLQNHANVSTKKLNGIIGSQ
jgi:hypothetical protein